ncbi:unnamed protein product [Staurois parvus]|uniref:Uncharacterized protein n=1 Tax=Staurois parvus TaxID=386267 RepID=A0ABN9EWU3_9NEOB|nr:unnamed protein product [Staurois parvus]
MGTDEEALVGALTGIDRHHLWALKGSTHMALIGNTDRR